jgi:hypothetical protein
MDPAERALLASTVLDALSARSGDADAVLLELGWLDLLAAEPADAIAIVFDALGRTNASASMLDDVMLAALGIEPRLDLAVVLPGGLATPRATRAVELVVAGHVVPASTATIEPVHGIDPDLGLVRITVDVAAADARDAWEQAVAAGRRAVSHQLAGASRAMLALAVEHARERVQFGRPIARFQAVRHRLADALVAIEGLEAALGAAADEPGALTAALAKAIACRTARSVAAQAQQVLAGIGFTTDHAFHRYVKRTIALDGLLGSADDLALDLGRELLRTRTVPTLIELEGPAR